MQLIGKHAIVTGGANGIGAAIARRFVEEGATVVIADIDDEGGNVLEADLNHFGTARFINTDVGERLDIHNLVANAIEAHGPIDILVNNAGIEGAGDFLDISEADFDAVMRVNLKGTFLCSQAVARTMVERVKAGGPPGTIINITSLSAIVALRSQVAYTVSKGGLSQLTVAMAQELAPHGIRVNAVGPGAVETVLFKKVLDRPGARDLVLSRTPLGRVGEPEEMAGVALFLAGKDSSFINGQTIYADGGLLGQAYPLERKSKT